MDRQMQTWPHQSGAQGFYGNPRGRGGQASSAWEAKNLVPLKPPFRMTYAGKPIATFKIHRLCAESLMRVLQTIWDQAGREQARVDEWGVSIFGGTYNFRLKRGSSTLSMHAFGCAIDLAPERFPMGRAKATFCAEVTAAFAAEGWVNLPRDRMHFQAARI
ncbi:M15 family metallopeptidase [Aestuariivirga litoralis]|uniref:M15 family metallopeptidase n=1 Tax=Aestuariivirga litoralis TaxID=2650924 RepID=UPI0018C5E831|nr:M15 family metallopeptidase [Aestuariivirga litoralis]